MEGSDSKINFSIIVPTYNRKDDIIKFIEEISDQEYKGFEVLIIDDHGEESISEFIPNDSEIFSFYRLKENKGQAYARNFGLAKAKHDIVLFMDDDAWFESVNALSNIYLYFKNDPQLGCLMFNIKEPNRVILSSRFQLKEGQEIGEFIACGVAFRKEAISSIGGFSSILHSYGEETDISLSLIQKGYKIRFSEKIILFHNYLPDKRSIKWIKRFKHNTIRNDILIVAMRYPLVLIPFYIPLKTLSHLNYSFKNNDSFKITLFQSTRALVSSILLLPKIIKYRNAVTFNTFNKWKMLRWKVN